MSNAVNDAHDALVLALNAEARGEGLEGFIAVRDATLPGEAVPKFLNVVLAPQPAQVLGEQMGLGEDAVLVEFVQPFDVELIVRDEDPVTRRATFTGALKDLASALLADRTLGGVASGLELAPANFENHTYAGAPYTAAAVIPVRVALRGLASTLS